MYRNEEVCIVVPCHNESGNVAAVVESLCAEIPGAGILIVDDASSDDTLERALATGRSEAIRLPVNIGVGGAIQAGFKYALRHGFRYAVKFDGDGQHRAADIARLLVPIAEGKADVVVGSRFLESNGGYRATIARRTGIVILNTASSLLTGWRITDSTSGFRAYGHGAMRFLAEHYSSLDYPEPEEPVLLYKNRFILAEVPTIMNERSWGSSSIRPVQAGYFMMKMLLCVLMVFMRKPVR